MRKNAYKVIRRLRCHSCYGLKILRSRATLTIVENIVPVSNFFCHFPKIFLLQFQRPVRSGAPAERINKKTKYREASHQITPVPPPSTPAPLELLQVCTTATRSFSVPVDCRRPVTCSRALRAARPWLCRNYGHVSGNIINWCTTCQSRENGTVTTAQKCVLCRGTPRHLSQARASLFLNFPALSLQENVGCCSFILC